MSASANLGLVAFITGKQPTEFVGINGLKSPITITYGLLRSSGYVERRACRSATISGKKKQQQARLRFPTLFGSRVVLLLVYIEIRKYRDRNGMHYTVAQ